MVGVVGFNVSGLSGLKSCEISSLKSGDPKEPFLWLISFHVVYISYFICNCNYI